MTEPAHVLLIGNQVAQLQVHSTVLRHFWTIDTASTSEFEPLLPSTHVAVLCHTLTDTERQRVVSVVSRNYPELLLVKINGYDSGPHAGIEATVDLLHGPGALVSILYQLLTERSLPSRNWPGIEMDAAPGVH